jgi:phage shock protein PspC (stress-responsive transcriptional regulator)
LQIPATSLAVVLIATFFIGVVTGAIFVLLASIMPTKRKPLDG